MICPSKDELKLSYTKTPKSSTHERDQKDLSDFIQNCEGVAVTYEQYSCSSVQVYTEMPGQRSDGKNLE